MHLKDSSVQLFSGIADENCHCWLSQVSLAFNFDSNESMIHHLEIAIIKYRCLLFVLSSLLQLVEKLFIRLCMLELIMNDLFNALEVLDII